MAAAMAAGDLVGHQVHSGVGVTAYAPDGGATLQSPSLTVCPWDSLSGVATDAILSRECEFVGTFFELCGWARVRLGLAQQERSEQKR